MLGDAQMLSFPLSATPEFLWASSGMKSASNVLSLLALDNLGSPMMSEVAYFVALGYAVSAIFGFFYVGYATTGERTLPPIMIQVR